MKRLLAFSTLLCLPAVTWGQTFSSQLTGSGVIQGGDVASTETATASATFLLSTEAGNPDATELQYEIFAPEFDLDGTKTPDLGDDITAIHLHTLTSCAAPTCSLGDTAGTTHVLNIFGTPREDDADLLVQPGLSLISGTWDPSDANDLTPAPTFTPNDFLDELAAGELFLMIHTRAFPGGAVGGVIVPEPSSATFLATLMLLGGLFRRRH